MTFTDKLDSLMKRKNLNPHSLSAETGIPYMTIKNWYVRGVDSVKLSTVKVLADFFKVPLDYFGDDNNETDTVIKPHHIDSISHRITSIMTYRKINISQLANMLSMDGNALQRYISSICDDEVSPEDDMLKRIAAALGLKSADAFFQRNTFTTDSYENYISFLEGKADDGLPMTPFESDYYFQYINEDIADPHHETFKVFEKYTALDYHGKRIVGAVLTEEYERCNAVKHSQSFSGSRPNIQRTFSTYRTVPIMQIPDIPPSARSEWKNDIDLPVHPDFDEADIIVSQSDSQSMAPFVKKWDVMLVHLQDTIKEGEIGVYIYKGQSCFRIKRNGLLTVINSNSSDTVFSENEGTCYGKVLRSFEIGELSLYTHLE